VSNDRYPRRRALDGELEALMQLGRRRDAYARAGTAIRLPDAASEADRELAARAFARLAIADRRIDGRGLGDRTALALGPREAQSWPAVFVDGLDAALRAWPGGDPTRLARARASLETLQALAGEDARNEVGWAATLVEAAIAASQDEHQQMALFLAHAADLEANPATIWLGGDLLVPSRELAAELWLRTYRYDDARREARAVLEAHPGRVSPYVVLGRAAARVKDATAAAEAWRKVIELRAAADADDSLRLEAQQALAGAR
jgi:tetratricopeptide (TPR) repeat protein